MNNRAPIVLFVYNRPWHTKQTLEALAKNILADQSTLYIYADGPKENANIEQLNKINEVRELIHEKKWCKDVIITEREKNIGLSNSVIAGVTEIINKYGKIIVLEDDIITSACFLEYMNNALDLYKQEELVMNISGYFFPIKKKLPETFFLRRSSCWGWGTWSRSWNYFNHNSILLYNQIIFNKEIETQFNLNNSYNFSGMLKQNAEGLIDSWDICWYASTFVNKGLCLFPRISLVRNIGHDNAGIHCRKTWSTAFYSKQKISKEIIVKKVPIIESQDALGAIIQFNQQFIFPSFFVRVKEKNIDIFFL